MLKYVVEVTSIKKKFAELTVGEKDKETWPELRYTFEVSFLPPKCLHTTRYKVAFKLSAFEKGCLFKFDYILCEPSDSLWVEIFETDR